MLLIRSLKEMEELFEEYSFLRVHRSFFVNLNEVERYVRGDGGYVMMSDVKEINTISPFVNEYDFQILAPKG